MPFVQMQSPLEGLPLRVPKEILCGAANASPRDAHCHTSVPQSHITPFAGWGSDPHGPILWRGRYHLFHQARPGTCQWFWGMRWDHLVSNDLVTWARLPPALIPTPGWLDADGCFTGNVQIHPATGVPMLFYTGARLRHKPSQLCREPPVEARNELMLHWETQLCAVSDPNDELLVRWTKVDTPWMELPPCAWLTSWRDPFFVPPEVAPSTGRPAHIVHDSDTIKDKDSSTAHTQPSLLDTPTREHMMLIGSGLEGVGGTALIYRSKDLAAGWRFDGYLCTWPNQDTGVCWECPMLLNLPTVPPGLTCFSTSDTHRAASASSDVDEQLRAAVDDAWERAGARPADWHRLLPLRSNKQSSSSSLYANGMSSFSYPNFADASFTSTSFAHYANGASPFDMLPHHYQDAASICPAVADMLEGALAVTGTTRTAADSALEEAAPTLRSAGSATLQAALTLSRQTSEKQPVEKDEAEQTLAERLIDETILRTRAAQEAAAAAASRHQQSVAMSMTNDVDTSCLLSPPGAATQDTCGAQDALIQTIHRGRQEAVAALVAEDVSLPTAVLSRKSSVVTPDGLGVAVLTQKSSVVTPDGVGMTVLTQKSSVTTPDGVGVAVVTQRTSVVTADGVAVAADQVPLCDVKAVQEASLGGLGYAGVLSHCSPHDAANQRLAQHKADTRKPVPPFFPPDCGMTKKERQAACRAYALASAAVQGLDLNMPDADAEVVRRCKMDPSSAPKAARPDQRWFFGLAPDAATYGILYFLGQYKDNRFFLEDAAGPFKLDLGNTLYAPVAFYDERNGRHLVWGYLKELTVLPAPPSLSNKYTSSGCVSLPRLLYLLDGHLHQVPLPEMSKLRTGLAWKVHDFTLQPSDPLFVPDSAPQQHADMEIVIRRGTASSVIIAFHSWRPQNEGAAALRYNFDTQRLELLLLTPASSDRHPKDLHVIDKCEGELSIVTEPDGVFYEAFIDPKVPPVPDMNPEVPDWIRMKAHETGGFLRNRDKVELRIFLDASALEVFTGCGQTLSTRVYRGWEQPQSGSKISVACAGGSAILERFDLHSVKSAWLREDADAPLQPPTSRDLLIKWLQSFS